MIPGGALPTTPDGACRPGSVGRQTGSSTIPATTIAPTMTMLSRAAKAASGRSTGSGRATSGATANTAPSGHQATPRIA